MLNVTGYEQSMLWDKKEDNGKDGAMSKKGVFPVTNWESILQRPRVIELDQTVVDTPNLPFALVVTGEEELSDDIIYELFNQIW